MGKDCGGKNQSRARAAQPRNHLADDECQQAPAQRTCQAVRVGHVVEVEWAGSGDARDDPYFLNAQQNEDRPENIHELYSDEQKPEGKSLVFIQSFAGEAGTIMADEQFTLLFLKSRPLSFLNLHR